MAVRIAALDAFRQVTVRKVPEWLGRARAAVLRLRSRGDPSTEALYLLSPPERVVLRALLATRTLTLRAPTVTAVALSLEHAGIVAIYREPPGSGGGYLLRPNAWVLEQLRRHTDLLQPDDRLQLDRLRGEGGC